MLKGDCYEVHIRFLRDEVETEEQGDWTLCHGTVINAAGQTVKHCWLEQSVSRKLACLIPLSRAPETWIGSREPPMRSRCRSGENSATMVARARSRINLAHSSISSPGATSSQLRSKRPASALKGGDST